MQRNVTAYLLMLINFKYFKVCNVIVLCFFSMHYNYYCYYYYNEFILPIQECPNPTSVKQDSEKLNRVASRY